MMVCHQVVATLDVVISDLRRDKVNEMLPWLEPVFWLASWGGRGRSMSDGFRRDLGKHARTNKKSKQEKLNETRVWVTYTL